VSLANHHLETVRAASLMVATRELVENITPAGQMLFNKLLTEAVSKVVDAKFLDLMLSTGVAQLEASGSSEDHVEFDLRRLLLAVNGSSAARYYFVCGVDAAKRAASFPKTFPAMSASGGEMLNTTALVSSGIDPDTIALIDASGIAADLDTIELKASEQASIEMRDNPAQDATTGAASNNLVSMFQSNTVALMSTVLFGAEALRDDAIATLSNIQWGDEVVTA